MKPGEQGRDHNAVRELYRAVYAVCFLKPNNPSVILEALAYSLAACAAAYGLDSAEVARILSKAHAWAARARVLRKAHAWAASDRKEIN